MKITKIERQKKNPERYSLFVNDQFMMGVHEELLIQFALYKDQPVDQDFINALQEAEYQQSIYSAGLNYLSYGLRSIQEIQDYLEKWLREKEEDSAEEPEDISTLIHTSLQRLQDQGYLNDEVFAGSYVRTQALINHKGPDAIRQELRQKGVSDSNIDSGLAEYPFQQEMENLEEVARKFKRSRSHRLPPKMLRNRLVDHLRTKGFSKDSIDLYLADAEFEESQDHQESLLDKEAQKLLRTRRRRYSGRELQQRVKQGLYQRGFDGDLINQWEQDHQALFEEGEDDE